MKQQKDKVKMFRDIVNEMADLYEKKNANYGDSFGQLYDTLGPVSGLVPLHNKLDRATSLIKGNKNNFESLEDTLKDLACYAIMNLIELETRNKKSTQTQTKEPDIPDLTSIPNVNLVGNPVIQKNSNPCDSCAWHNTHGNIYVGDTPCTWCMYGRLTCRIGINSEETSTTGCLNNVITATQTTTTEGITKQPEEKSSLDINTQRR